MRAMEFEYVLFKGLQSQEVEEDDGEVVEGELQEEGRLQEAVEVVGGRREAGDEAGPEGREGVFVFVLGGRGSLEHVFDEEDGIPGEEFVVEMGGGGGGGG